MMCYNDDDDSLWKEDPYEYIRMKFGKPLKYSNQISIRMPYHMSIL